MIDEGPAGAPVTVERREAVTAAARLLENAGHRIKPIAAPTLDFEREASARFFAARSAPRLRLSSPASILFPRATISSL